MQHKALRGLTSSCACVRQDAVPTTIDSLRGSSCAFLVMSAVSEQLACIAHAERELADAMRQAVCQVRWALLSLLRAARRASRASSSPLSFASLRWTIMHTGCVAMILYSALACIAEACFNSMVERQCPAATLSACMPAQVLSREQRELLGALAPKEAPLDAQALLAAVEALGGTSGAPPALGGGPPCCSAAAAADAPALVAAPLHLQHSGGVRRCIHPGAECIHPGAEAPPGPQSGPPSGDEAMIAAAAVPAARAPSNGREAGVHTAGLLEVRAQLF